MILKKCGTTPKPGVSIGRYKYRILVEGLDKSMEYVNAYNTNTPAPNGDKVLSVRVFDDAPAIVWLARAKAGDFD